jgi:hypothetical protein
MNTNQSHIFASFVQTPLCAATIPYFSQFSSVLQNSSLFLRDASYYGLRIVVCRDSREGYDWLILSSQIRRYDKMGYNLFSPIALRPNIAQHNGRRHEMLHLYRNSYCANDSPILADFIRCQQCLAINNWWLNHNFRPHLFKDVNVFYLVGHITSPTRRTFVDNRSTCVKSTSIT